VEPILTKREIAELLTSLKDGRGNTGSGAPPPEDGRVPSSHREISLFDLGSPPEEATPIENLEFIINRFRTTLSSYLSHYLQRSVSMEPIESDFLAFSSYLSSDNSKNVATIIDMAPLKFPAIVSCDAKLSSTLLEMMLGGKTASNDNAPPRPATKLDLHILKRVMLQLCTVLESVFQPVIPISCSPIGTAATCTSISLFDAKTQMAVFAMNMSVGTNSGRMDLLFPIKAFEPFRESLATVMLQNDLDHDRWTESIVESLDETALTLRARTTILDLSVKQLIEMKSGDVFLVDHEPGTSVDLLVEGVAKFSAETEYHRQKRNVRITSIAT